MLRTRLTPFVRAGALSLVAAALAFTACKRGNRRDPNKLYIVTTTGMLADAAREIGGAHVHVEALMGPGVDPHLYKATASDTRRLAEGQLIIYNGLHLEGKMQSIFEKVGRSRPVVAAGEVIPKALRRKPPELDGFYDPHVWFDVSLWQRVVGRIRDAMIQVDKKHAHVYRQRAKVYLAKLAKLHTWAKQTIAQVPPDRRYLVTSHDAFGYFGRAYGITVVGIQGVSTVAESGVKDVERVIQLIVDKKIRAIFVETSVSKRSIESVLSGVKARGHDVKIGGSLYSDAMGKRGTPTGNYLGMVRHNVSTFVRAMGVTPKPLAKPKASVPTKGEKPTASLSPKLAPKTMKAAPDAAAR